MEQQNDKTTVFFMVAVMAFAIVLVDDRWVRAGLGLLPALLLAQRALGGVGVGSAEAERVGAAAGPCDDETVRACIDELLKYFREFYAMCHLMTGGKMEPDEAKELAGGIERRLNELLAKITAAARREAGVSS